MEELSDEDRAALKKKIEHEQEVRRLRIGGKNTKNVGWLQICVELDAEYIDGGRFGTDQVRARIGEWTIALDTFTRRSSEYNREIYTRMRAPYLSNDGFTFAVHREGILDSVGKLIGMQDIEVGYAELDDQFIIKGNDEAKVRDLFSNPKIREPILHEPSIQFRVTKASRRGAELYLQISGSVQNVRRLRSLFELFTETLNKLRSMGSV